MIRSVLTFFVVLLTLCATTFAASQFDTTRIEQSLLDFKGGGARAQAMGNAYIALSDDVSGGSWNPAGLFVHEKPMLGLSLGSFMPRGQFTGSSLSADQSGSFRNVNYAAFVAPIRIKGHPFVGGISYSQNFEEFANSAAYAISDTLNSIFDTAQITDIETGEYHGNLNSINFSVATRIYDQVAFGLAVNVYTGEAIHDRLFSQVIDSAVPIEVAPQHVLYSRDSTVIDTSKYSGINFTLGLRHDGERLDLGLMVRTPFSLEMENGQSVYRVVRYNGLEQGVTDTIYYDDEVRKVEVPMFIGFGLAYNISENFLFALDAEYRGFSGKKIKTRDSLFILADGDKTEFYSEKDPAWNNVFAIRMGTEYILNFDNTYIPLVPLRAGFGYVPAPQGDVDVSGSTSSVGSTSLSLGTGIHWSQIYLDAAYVYNKLSTKNEQLGSELDNKSHQFSLMFTGYF